MKVSNPCGIYFNFSEHQTKGRQISKFQIPVGYILTHNIPRFISQKEKFQIPVGYILTDIHSIVANVKHKFQIPVGYILTFEASSFFPLRT